MKTKFEEDIYMPLSGIGSGSQNYAVASTLGTPRNQTDSSSELTRNLSEVKKSPYGLSRGHQRQNAADFRKETFIDSIRLDNPVSDSTITLVDKLVSGKRINL